MGFDPKKYLAETGGFDPKAYLDNLRNEQRATTLLGQDETPYWASEDPTVNPNLTPKPAPYKPPMWRGNHQMAPWEERNMNAGMAGLLAGAATAATLGAAAPAMGGAGLPGLLTRFGVSALGGAASGEAEGAVRAAQEGRRGGAILDAAAEGGAGGALTGGALHVGGEAAAGLGGLLRRGKGLVPRYLRGKDAGVYDAPAMAELPKGAEGVQKAAENAHGRVLTRDAALDQAAAENYQATPAADLKRPIDRQKLIATLQAERAKNINPDTNKPINAAVDARYAKAIADLGDEGTVNTTGGTLGLRRGLQQEASFGNPAPSPEQGAARTAYRGMRSAVRDASPDIAAADDAYAAHARQAARRRDILYRSEAPVTTGPGVPAPAAEPTDVLAEGGGQGAAAEMAAEPQMRVAKEQAGIRTLKREGDTNEPGLNAQQFLDELRGQDPEFAAALDFIGNKKALEGTRFGTPHLATHLTGATAHVAGVPLRYIGQNARALATEVLDPALQAGAQLRLAAPFSGAVPNPLFQAQEETSRRHRGRAHTLSNGGR